VPSFEEDESLVETTEEEDISSVTLIRHKCKAKTRLDFQKSCDTIIYTLDNS
jgi:hypothetical protein